MKLNLTEGEQVVYCSSEVCTFEGEEKRTFDGKHFDVYYKLVPISQTSSSYYVPADRADEKIRALITKDEVKNIIGVIPEIKPVWIVDNNARRQEFHSMLRSNDYREVIRLIKSVRARRGELVGLGRKLSSSDEMAMRAAESKVCEEFSAVLEVSLDDVRKYIEDKMCAKA